MTALYFAHVLQYIALNTPCPTKKMAAVADFQLVLTGPSMSGSSEYVFGIHAVNSLIRRQAAEKVWVLAGRRDRRMSELVNLAKQNGIHVESVQREKLDILSQGGRHQGVVAQACADSMAAKGTDVSLEDVLARQEANLLLLILDGVQDPHNLGACLRTADAAGVHAVIAPKDRAVSLNATVRKVACGAAETVPFIQVANLANAMKQIQQSGVWITGTTGDVTTSIYDVDLTGRVAIVMGAEGEGMRRLTREHCDTLAMIPMAGSVASLNVSVATGVCLYETVRQRQSPK